jgi:hypothetical protein
VSEVDIPHAMAELSLGEIEPEDAVRADERTGDKRECKRELQLGFWKGVKGAEGVDTVESVLLSVREG